MGCGYWLLFVDLDGTLWDHSDVSALRPPFRRVSESSIADANGVVVSIHPDIVKLVDWARRHGAVVSTLSWNDPEKALEALRAFGLEGAFDYHVIEPHPYKGDAALKLLDRLREERGCIPPPCGIVYVDDRSIHLENVRERLGDVVFLQAWRDFRSFEEAREIVEARIRACTGSGSLQPGRLNPAQDASKPRTRCGQRAGGLELSQEDAAHSGRRGQGEYAA
ncbi:MAG: magnesium-dependent phosphatase-1 [Thermoproteota archaeon]